VARLALLIVASKSDPASMNILKELMELVEFEHTEVYAFGERLEYCRDIDSYLIVIEGDLIRTDFLQDINLDIDGLLFLSKHASEKGIPSLLVHFPGNWTEDASMGGSPRKLSVCDPILHKALVMSLYEKKSQGVIPDKYLVGIEVTHHGPTIDKASVFIEIGSSVQEWKDRRVGRIVAESVVDAVTRLPTMRGGEAYVGFGGPHYAPKFLNVLISDRSVLLGHIAPKYVIDSIDEAIVREAIEKSTVEIKKALIDWKGLRSSQRKKVLSILGDLGLSYQKI